MEEENLSAAQSEHTENARTDLNFEYGEKLKENYQTALSSCLQKIEHWEKMKKDYEVLRSRLETLPERISHDIMVPFGSHAFMPGQLTHTNEIMTLLGANWFAEVSAKHAVEISNRRIQKCEKMLQDLECEKKQCENYLDYVHAAIGSDLMEIVEHDDHEYVEKSKRRRIQHSKKVETPSGNVSAKNGSLGENSEDVAEVSDNLQVLSIGKQEVCDELSESVPFEGDEDDCDDTHESDDPESSSEEDQYEKDEDTSDEHLKNDEKHVKWKDQEGEKMKNRITFTHSSHKSKGHSNIKPMAISKTKIKTKDPGPLSPVNIQSPLDIYKCFSTKPDQCKPKSILKRTSSIDDTDMLHESTTMKSVEDEPILKTRFKEQTAFTGEIVEHEMVGSNLTDKIGEVAQRPPSRFKAQRQSKQR